MRTVAVQGDVTGVCITTSETHDTEGVSVSPSGHFGSGVLHCRTVQDLKLQAAYFGWRPRDSGDLYHIGGKIDNKDGVVALTDRPQLICLSMLYISVARYFGSWQVYSFHSHKKDLIPSDLRSNWRSHREKLSLSPHKLFIYPRPIVRE